MSAGEPVHESQRMAIEHLTQTIAFKHAMLTERDAEIARLNAALARVTALLADARLVCGFVRGWWPWLEDGISWPQKDEDNEILRAAERVCGAKEIEG